MVSLDDLWRTPELRELAPVDRPGHVAENEYQQSWQDNGYVILKDFLPDDLMQAYIDVFPSYGKGFGAGTPYMHIPELRALSLYKPLMDVMESIIGEPMGLHLNLTSWTSSKRNFHMDTYLNPQGTGSHYVAVWMALEDITSDSGPFQWLKGSHKWPTLQQDKVLSALGQDGSNAEWPRHSEELLTPLFLEKAEQENIELVTYLPRAGDCLLWSSTLVHRGSDPANATASRRALISHYSGIYHRSDMPNRAQDENGSTYFVF